MLNEFHLRVGVEASHGTVATTFVSIPVEEFETKLMDPAEYPEESRGDGERAHVALKQVRHQTATAKGRIYHDCAEPWLRTMFGTPTITNNADGTRQLVFTGKPDPASLSTQWLDTVTGRQSLYMVGDQLKVEFGGKDALKYDISLMGMPEIDIAAPAAAFSSAIPFVHWQAAVTIGGVTSSDVVSYSLTYKRNVEPFHTAQGGASDPRAPLRFDYGKKEGSLDLTLDFTSQAEYTQAKALATRGVVATFTDTAVVIGSGSRNPSISFNVPGATWSTKEVDLAGTAPALNLIAEQLLATSSSGSLIVTLVTV